MTTRRSAPRRSKVKKTASRSSSTAARRGAVSSKTVVKKPAARKRPAASKKAPAARPSPKSKKPGTAKKTVARRAHAVKAPARKTSVKKPVLKRVPSKKPAAKKPPARKAVPAKAVAKPAVAPEKKMAKAAPAVTAPPKSPVVAPKPSAKRPPVSATSKPKAKTVSDLASAKAPVAVSPVSGSAIAAAPVLETSKVPDPAPVLTIEPQPSALVPLPEPVPVLAVTEPPPPPPKPVVPRRALVTFTLATRKSPLAIAQAEQAVAYMQERLEHHAFRMIKMVTTGDRQDEWSLEREGGKGLFTGELEMALHDYRADLAVHSTKDLPTEMTAGLDISGYLPRQDPHDVLVIREGLARPASIATGSPRRRLQLQRQYAKATFVEIRGNVETRLQKIEEGLADATVLAAAGLKRLGITERPGLRFQVLPLAVCVPAVGQGAIAVQARQETAAALRSHFDEPTRIAVELERTFLRKMGAGCHTAFAVHYDGVALHLFHDLCGYQRFGLPVGEALNADAVATRLIEQLKLNG